MDVVVTLHACDTATDYALAKAIGWNAKVILSVPRRQHEVNGQFAKADKTQCYDGCLDPIMDYGLLRERFAACDGRIESKIFRSLRDMIRRYLSLSIWSTLRKIFCFGRSERMRKELRKKAREQRLKNVDVFADRADVGEIVGR